MTLSPALSPIALQYWLDRRSGDRYRAMNARRNCRRSLSRLSESQPKGRGNRAWKRLEAAQKAADCIVWPDYIQGGGL